MLPNHRPRTSLMPSLARDVCANKRPFRDGPCAHCCQPGLSALSQGPPQNVGTCSTDPMRGRQAEGWLGSYSLMGDLNPLATLPAQ